MSNSLLEAMATALPCVASDIGGNQDLLGHGGAGLLVAESTPEAWAIALIRLLNDAERRQTLGRRGQASRIDQEFDLRLVVTRYVSLYHRLIEKYASSR